MEEEKLGLPPIIRGTPEQIKAARAQLDEWCRQGAIEQHALMQRMFSDYSERQSKKIRGRDGSGDGT